MRPQFVHWLRRHDEQVFCVEQWIALFAGVGCIGLSIWSRMHLHEESLSAAPLHWQTKALAGLRWPLAIAVGLVGAVLTRFAFSKNYTMVPDQDAPTEKTSHKQAPSQTVETNSIRSAKGKETIDGRGTLGSKA